MAFSAHKAQVGTGVPNPLGIHSDGCSVRKSGVEQRSSAVKRRPPPRFKMDTFARHNIRHEIHVSAIGTCCDPSACSSTRGEHRKRATEDRALDGYTVSRRSRSKPTGLRKSGAVEQGRQHSRHWRAQRRTRRIHHCAYPYGVLYCQDDRLRLPPVLP